MQVCTNCGCSNKDNSKFCIECGKELKRAAAAQKKEKPSGVLTPREIGAKLEEVLEDRKNRKRADIMFCLDCTGSMSGEIEAIKDTIIEFSGMIEKDGVRARIGLIEFRDRLFGEEHIVHDFNGQVFTKDAAVFKNTVSALKAGGGHDEPESSLDAVMLACNQPFEDGAARVIVLITDAPPHIPDMEAQSIDEVVERIKAAGIGQFYCAIRTGDVRNDVYLKLIVEKGLAFDLGTGDDFRTRSENFKKTLKSLGKTISTGTR